MMQRRKTSLVGLLMLCFALSTNAHINPRYGKKKTNVSNGTSATLREPCSPGVSQSVQEINNVRARLLINGDVWWDGTNEARYVIPKVEAGEPEVSSIFAAAVWLGGLDEGGSLKLAVKQFGSANGTTDFWPGPIDPGGLGTDGETCEKWDRHFKVLGTDILLHRFRWEAANAEGVPYREEDIPESIRGWPAKGNEFFFEVHNFSLPLTDQGLAGYFDQDRNDKYEPDQGDFPYIEIKGCEESPEFPDEMIFWIYNDVGNLHTESESDPMNMEVQVQSFAYATNDEINDMTFQRYKLINRGTEDVDSTFFAFWVDADLGCGDDDYIGCDTSRSLAYYYNSDAVDGTIDEFCDCGGVETYCEKIPMIGIDYFRGPLDEFGDQIGMSSFIYFNNPSGSTPPPIGTTDPITAQQFYNYLSGSWADGTPISRGGDGYNNPITTEVKYVFPDPPNEMGWSMAQEELGSGDRRTVQASGPFKLKEDTKNELIIGAVWVPDVANHPTPDINRLLFADDLAQALFNSCFKIPQGPDAPDLDWIEMDQELIVVLTNDTVPPFSNNAFELYEEPDFEAPPVDDSTYVFEGYKVFQMRGQSDTDINDIDRARLVIQVDVKNGVNNIYNWNAESNPLEPSTRLYFPTLMVEGADEGIQHSFNLTTDAFSNEPLVNHKKYYYRAIAYGYNNYQDFDVTDGVGQKRPYLEGRKNIQTYTVIPRPIVDRQLNAEFDEGVTITRLDGKGLGGHFVDLSEESRTAMMDGTFDGSIVYKKGRGPIEVKIYNPLEVKDGLYQLRFTDENMENDRLDQNVRWELENELGQVTKSEVSINALNEQLIADYGFSVNIVQSGEPGTKTNESNGAIGIELEYEDPEKPAWFAAIPDDSSGPFNYVKSELGFSDQIFDPKGNLSGMGNGAFVPFFLCDWRTGPNTNFFLSPAWDMTSSFQTLLRMKTDSLRDLNNIDIVFTSDVKKWSRCVVVETANHFYYNGSSGLETQTEGNAKNFQLRAAPSVGLNSGPDGRPLPDNAIDENGVPINGMGWFPGYAIDVETGQRLNIFFGENSVYDCAVPTINDLCTQGRFIQEPNGRDMMWNPSEQGLVETANNDFGALNAYAGGQHFIYVTDEPYDSCKVIYQQLKVTTFGSNEPIEAKAKIRWASFPILNSETTLLSYEEGLIPNDLRVKIRVDNPYQVALGTGQNNGYPAYGIKLENVAPKLKVTTSAVDSILASINVVPNPYYGFSDYENSPFSNRIKITNLPAKANITIYTLDGKFIRQYKRDEVGAVPSGNNRGINRNQVVPDVEWNLQNSAGIPISAGVYLIHVDAPGYGERIIKWFGIARQFDPSGL